MKFAQKYLSLILSTGLLAACGDGSFENNGNASPIVAAANPGIINSNNPLIARIKNDEFNAIDSIEQYRVANKLYSTLYKGISVDEFFDLSAGLTMPQTINDGSFINATIGHLQSNLSIDEKNRLDLAILGSDLITSGDNQYQPGKFSFSRDMPREIPLARIHTYPMSRSIFVEWMAWHLSNSILFSPSAELDSADMNDVQNVFRRLVNGINASESIPSIVEKHMRSEENWRRFRSPEDNTREMMEVFLGLEDKDDDVPAASKACQDWYLTSENEGYKLSYTDFPNTQPQQVLGSDIVSCDDFYRLIASHPNLLPNISRILVGYFYADKNREEQSQIVNALVAENPDTFEALFGLIIFSSEYLLRNERLRSYEESFLATAERLRWRTREDTFKSLASGRGGLYRSNMAEMGWPAMSAKLGRAAGIATDSLSFANFHKGLREELLLDAYRWSGPLGVREQEAIDDTDEQISPTVFERRTILNSQLKRLTVDELIDYLFISVAMRRASPFEKQQLTQVYDNNDYLRHEEERSYVRSGRMKELARTTFDYLSRLSELYYLKSTAGVEQ